MGLLRVKRDLADFWNLLWEAALGLCAAFALLNAFAPPQDLPWTPLDLSAPLGQATRAKVADFELSRSAAPPAEEVTAVTDACLALLREAGVQAERAEDRDDGGFCVVRGAVRITGGAVTPLAPGGLVMQCPMAIRYVLWDRQVLRPAAEAAFGTSIASVDTYGTYSCRRIYGSTEPGARPSEHARANALDVAGVTLADGRRVERVVRIEIDVDRVGGLQKAAGSRHGCRHCDTARHRSGSRPGPIPCAGAGGRGGP